MRSQLVGMMLVFSLGCAPTSPANDSGVDAPDTPPTQDTQDTQDTASSDAVPADAASEDAGPPIEAMWFPGTGPLARVSGQAFVFGPNASGLSLQGATISVLEAPQVRTTVASDGTFALDVPSGAPLSFVFSQTGFAPNQSATIQIDTAGLTMLGFQTPTNGTFDLLARLARLSVDPTRCQIATTVSRINTAPYGGDALGEPGVVATIEPPVPNSGPIYFAYASAGVIYPDRNLTATSVDGGVIFANVPPGEYTLHASKTGLSFSTAKIRCRAGVLVNAAPPYGLQQL